MYTRLRVRKEGEVRGNKGEEVSEYWRVVRSRNKRERKHSLAKTDQIP